VLPKRTAAVKAKRSATRRWCTRTLRRSGPVTITRRRTRPHLLRREAAL
jgi:hypothetical protein